MIEKIGNIYYDKWKSGFDGNICGTKGIYPTLTLSTQTGEYWLNMLDNPRPIILGSYSPSQNGIIVSPHGIALCIAGGGKGHDVDKPKILIEYD